ESLGLPLAGTVPPPEAEPAAPGLGPAAPGPASRELLACGFPDMAEDAAEAEGSMDVLFAASVATERGDHRRAVALLKSRHPELGTPDEGAVPLAVRRAFYPVAHLPLFSREAASHGISTPLLLALVRQESVFSPVARSRAGAVGLMQVMPSTGRLVARRKGQKGRPDLADPEKNVELGTAFFAGLLSRYDGDVVSALAAYNAGPGRVDRWRRARPGTPEDEFLESIPIAETRDYVRRVLFYREAYRVLLPLATSSAMAAFPVSPAP
ncbi:MAG: lytic transglycosylase domain-containing protein, partial [Acidobacteria bacterium ACB2]|nr:lytic transglycosylase domain-containing protein [Acidobacteria bacterium ACB2]